MQATNDSINELAKVIDTLTIDPSSLNLDEVDNETVDWYLSRLENCMNDGVFKAANAYLEHLSHDKTVNDSTRALILLKSFDIMNVNS